jgi:hypothetical protein
MNGTQARAMASDGEKTTSSAASAYSTRKVLQMEVETVIQEYRSAEEKPPFTPSELVVMATICREADAITLEDAMSWTIDTFSFYRQRLSGHTRLCEHHYGRITLQDFHHVLDSWEVPLVYAADENTLLCLETYSQSKQAFTTITAAARVFLLKWLEPRREGCFRLLDLPPEIRNTIYEMTLSFPKSGFVLPRIWYVERRLLLRHRDVNDDGRTTHPRPTFKEPHVETAALSSTLAIFLACKQVYREAAPFFYACNYFHFEDLETLGYMSRKMSANLSKHLSNVRVVYEYDREKEDTLCNVFTFLRSNLNLKVLTLEIYDANWFRLPVAIRQAFGRTSAYTKAEQIAGMKDLAALASKVETLNIEGDCPKIREYLTSERERARAVTHIPSVATEAPKQRS